MNTDEGRPGHQPNRVGTMINNMRLGTMLDGVSAPPDGIEVNDPNDAFLQAMAWAGEVATW